MAFDDSIQKEKNQIHLGYNVQRIREIIGMKQSALADNVGMSQQNISKLESSPVISDDTLEKLAKGLGVNPEFIKSFNEEKAVYIIQNNHSITLSDNSSNQYQPTINNDLDKIVGLFEKLLQSDKEKTELLAKTNDALQELLKATKKKEG